jgi:hypothetical protein
VPLLLVMLLLMVPLLAAVMPWVFKIWRSSFA